MLIAERYAAMSSPEKDPAEHILDMLASRPDCSIQVIENRPVMAPAPYCRLSQPIWPTTGKRQDQNPSLA